MSRRVSGPERRLSRRKLKPESRGASQQRVGIDQISLAVAEHEVIGIHLVGFTGKPVSPHVPVSKSFEPSASIYRG